MLFSLACNPQPKDDFTKEKAQQTITKGWSVTYPDILEAIQVPSFQDTTVVIKDTTDFRNNINKTISQLSEDGGGTIKVNPGRYNIKGSVFLASNIRLHLENGAELWFSPNPSDYLPVVKSRWEGTFLMNYSPLIYAIDVENIAITGKGLINGQTKQIWYTWKEKQDADKKQLRQMGNDEIPLEKRVFGAGHYLRPSAIEFINCKNVLLEDFSIKGSPFWTIHPVLSENITIRSLNIGAGTTNDDGINSESCKNVLIENCVISTHDDCVALKAGRDQDGWPYPPNENIIVRNNSFKTEVGSGFCIGSEMSAGVRNVFVENCELVSSGKHAFQFKSNPDRGGFIENVFIRNIKVEAVKYGFEFTTDYKGWRGNEYFTTYQGFYFQNIQIEEATGKSIVIKGRPEEPIRKVYFENCAIHQSPQLEVVSEASQILFENTKINMNLLPTND
ncbi:glycoside hydrolase family 28 protein [Flagellimonas sp. S174]|uniref:glycoside hydrolase family 28 protein n=1 Tax=Flagellimonas sp. S174 TaxID=3410790 RepID=UPI003BF532BC